jgi:hypothetical protein
MNSLLVPEKPTNSSSMNAAANPNKALSSLLVPEKPTNSSSMNAPVNPNKALSSLLVPEKPTNSSNMNAPVNPNKALWEKGDFTRIAECMRESGEALVQRLGISSGLKVLDLGCGDGTTAIPAAKLGAEVLGVDIASNLVAAGNQRAKNLGLAHCRFQEAMRRICIKCRSMRLISL